MTDFGNFKLICDYVANQTKYLTTLIVLLLLVWPQIYDLASNLSVTSGPKNVKKSQIHIKRQTMDIEAIHFLSQAGTPNTYRVKPRP